MRSIDSRGSGPAVALTGEPEIGKTSLLDALRERADALGLPVFRASSAEFERVALFGIFVDAFDDYLGSLNQRRFEQLAANELAELAEVFPSLAELSEDRRRALPDERYRAHRAVGALLELLSQRGPLVLILDDLQWAGDASIEPLTHPLHRRPKGGLLFALAFRKSQTPPTLLAALDRDAELVELAALSAADADDLLGQELGVEARAGLLRESGATPSTSKSCCAQSATTGPTLPRPERWGTTSPPRSPPRSNRSWGDWIRSAAACSRARRWWAIPSILSWRGSRRTATRPRRSGRSTT